jgi:predicted alternative tryptophan synthase beta-subunit
MLRAQRMRTLDQSQTKFLLEESQLPRRWYNIRSDMPTAPRPVLHPGTGEPIGPDDLAPLFPMELIGQEVSEQAEIEIPEEVLEIYSLLASDRALPCASARGGDRDAFAHLL